MKILAAILVGGLTHFRSLFLFISAIFPCFICFASPQHSTAYFAAILLLIHQHHLTVAMPYNTARMTRSGRITKQTSKSSLTNRSTASSTSRSRPRNSSTNLQVPRCARSKSRPNVSTTRQYAAEAAAIDNLKAEEEEPIQQLLVRRQNSDEDRQSRHEALVARREDLEAEEENNTHRGRTSDRPHHRCRNPRSALSLNSPALKTSFKETDGKTLLLPIILRFPAVSKTHIKNIYRCKFDVHNLWQLGNSFANVTSKETNEIEFPP